MRTLVIGGGGREHALAWKLTQSGAIKDVLAAPGNDGIAADVRCVPVPRQDPQAFLELAVATAADLTVVGPEAMLVAGIVDRFRAAGLPIVGPSQANARLEGSKVFAKDFFARHCIPTAASTTATSPEDARVAVARFGFPVVLKSDGLAAGKGVVIARDAAGAEAALAVLAFPLVVEEFLTGEEVSFIALSDGRNIAWFQPSQDHKTLYDGDQGPNTGGMGAYTDARILSSAAAEQIVERIVAPTVSATSFTGFLYAGLMMTAAGPKILEYNVRMGDPETQPLLHSLDADLGAVLLSAAHGELKPGPLPARPEPSLCVVLASQGYPGTPRTGVPIEGLDAAAHAGAKVFHAATRRDGDRYLTAGGRVLGVTASGATLAEARANAYRAADAIQFEGMQRRDDIGVKGLQRG